MGLFSERYGYVKPSEVLIREEITIEIQNAICSCIDRLSTNLAYDTENKIARYVWTSYLKQRELNFKNPSFITNYIESSKTPWYNKLDMIEAILESLYKNLDFDVNYWLSKNIVDDFVNDLNTEWKKNNFAYRIINNTIAEISSEDEVKAINQALEENTDNIRAHISQALHLCSDRENPDYRNSIKESISAVEYFCRKETGEKTLGKALNKWEKQGVDIPIFLNEAFQKLYTYTNQPDTGIRHALMEDKAVPTQADAIFMLVTCSAFVNYLRKKLG